MARGRSKYHCGCCNPRGPPPDHGEGHNKSASTPAAARRRSESAIGIEFRPALFLVTGNTFMHIRPGEAHEFQR